MLGYKMPDINYVRHGYTALFDDFTLVLDLEVCLNGHSLFMMGKPKHHQSYFKPWFFELDLYNHTVHVPSQSFIIPQDNHFTTGDTPTVSFALPNPCFMDDDRELRILGRELFHLYIAQHTPDYKQ